MKTINEIQKVSLTYSELINCNSVDTNRCGYLKKEEALKNGFSEVDWNNFLSRAKKLKKIIKTNGFSKASCFVLAKNDEGKLYLLDGQGRRKALELMSTEDGIDLSSWEFVCDLYSEPMTQEEMSKLIKDLNIGNTNWQTKDIRRSDAISSDDVEVKTAYKYTKDLMDKYQLSDYIVCLFTYGEKASHQRNSSSHPYSTKDYVSTKSIFTEAYLRFICGASVRVDKDGNLVPRSKSVMRKIRNTNFAISFNSCLRRIVEQHERKVEMAKDDIMYFVEKLLDASSGDDEFMKQFVTCEAKDKHVVANKVKKYCKKDSVKLALYSR